MLGTKHLSAISPCYQSGFAAVPPSLITAGPKLPKGESDWRGWFSELALAVREVGK